MRSALELRSPIMDYRLVEYSRLLPLEYVYNSKTGQKRILRDLLCRNVSPELFERRKKGFSMPVDLWFRKELKDILIDTVNMEALKEISELNACEVIKLRDNHLKGIENNKTPLWYIFSYMLWHRTYRSIMKKQSI